MNEHIRNLLIQSGLKDPRAITANDTFDSVYMDFSFIKLVNLTSESCAQMVAQHNASYNKIVKTFELDITPNKELSYSDASPDAVKQIFASSTQKQLPADGDFIVLSRVELLNYTNAVVKSLG